MYSLWSDLSVVPRSRSSVKFKVKNEGNIFKNKAVEGGHLCFTNTSFLFPSLSKSQDLKTFWEKPTLSYLSKTHSIIYAIFKFPFANAFKWNKSTFLAHLSTECSVSYCDHSPSFRSLSVHIYKYTPINTKLCQNVYDRKILNELYYGTNWTRIVRVVCSWIKKFAILDFFYTLASANIDQSVPNLALNLYAHNVSDEFDFGANRNRTSGVICPWIWKIAESDFVYTLASTNINQSAPNLVKMYVTIRSRMSWVD